jgi:hypothetical protein
MLSVPLLTALLIGSVLAPTDPVLADSIIAGKTAEENVPERLRNSITAESGANDGLALLLVMMPILLLTKSPGDAVAALAPRNAALAGACGHRDRSRAWLACGSGAGLGLRAAVLQARLGVDRLGRARPD